MVDWYRSPTCKANGERSSLTQIFSKEQSDTKKIEKIPQTPHPKPYTSEKTHLSQTPK